MGLNLRQDGVKIAGTHGDQVVPHFEGNFAVTMSCALSYSELCEVCSTMTYGGGVIASISQFLLLSPFLILLGLSVFNYPFPVVTIPYLRVHWENDIQCTYIITPENMPERSRGRWPVVK